ncbi:MAG TPA: HIT domain-containing protein [Acidimicrobiales bacterium]|nr:HIT domain-containing protein [Acidimicrobiales bacterium]
MERLWAGWRNEYVTSTGAETSPGGDACVLCRVAGAGDGEGEAALWRGARTVAVLNAFPYTSGHLMVMPTRHVGELEDLDPEESVELWDAVRAAVVALKAAYRPEGVNVGANLGRAAGAGVPGHLHLHVLPRWSGDTNFMTSVAEARVLPESLPTSGERLRAVWPARP